MTRKDQLIESDLHCLNPGNKLTDTVVRYYSYILMKTSPDIFILDPLFYLETFYLTEKEHYSFKTILSFPRDLFSFHFYKEIHWNIFVVNFITKRVALYHSLVQIINLNAGTKQTYILNFIAEANQHHLNNSLPQEWSIFFLHEKTSSIKTHNIKLSNFILHQIHHPKLNPRDF